MNQALEEVLFHAVLEKQKADRAAFLDAGCEGDPGLRRNLEALLEAHDAPNALLGTAVVSSAALNGAALACADATQPWVSREQIGEGGWGVVYVAEQTEPVRRRDTRRGVFITVATRSATWLRQAFVRDPAPSVAAMLDIRARARRWRSRPANCNRCGVRARCRQVRIG